MPSYGLPHAQCPDCRKKNDENEGKVAKTSEKYVVDDIIVDGKKV